MRVINRIKATFEFQKPSLSIWGQVHDLSHIKGWALTLVLIKGLGELGNSSLQTNIISGYGVMKSATPTTSQKCFGFSKYGILDFGYFKHFLAVPNIRIIDLRNYFCKHWNSWYLLFQTLELWILAFPILEFWILAFQPLEFPVLVFPNIRIQCFGFSKHWNSLFSLAFPQHGFLDFVFF